MNIFLQLFLYLDVFIIGAVFSVAIRHAREHYKTKQEVMPKKTAKTDGVPPKLREKLIEEAGEKYLHILNSEAEKLDSELSITGEKINSTVKKLAADIITKELEGFQAMFQKYQQQAAQDLDATKSQTEQYRQELKVKVEAEIETEKQRMVAMIDSNLSDAVMSFLVEALGHKVDLGSQSQYLIEMLESHKEELKKAVNNEV